MSERTDAEILAGIADEIDAHPERWTQGAFARNAHEDALGDGFHDRACRWCAVGFIERETKEQYSDGRAFALNTFLIDAGANIEWNDRDDRTPSEVAAAFRRASEIASAA